MSTNTERILAYNPLAGNGLSPNEVEVLAEKYGYELFDIGEYFYRASHGIVDQPLSDFLQADIIAVKSGDGTLFTVLRYVPEGSKVVHLPNGGQNIGAKSTGWYGMPHDQILQAVADQKTTNYCTPQGTVHHSDPTLPELIHWTIGNRLSTSTLESINRNRDLPNNIRRVIAAAEGFWQTASNRETLNIQIKDPRSQTIVTVPSIGYDIVKRQFPHFALFDFSQVKDLDLSEHDLLITYGSPQESPAPEFVARFMLDAFQIHILKQLPTHGGIDLIPISPQTTITVHPAYPIKTQFDTEIFISDQPISTTPQPKNPNYSTLIAKL